MIGLGLLQLRRWRNLSTIRTSDSTRHHQWRCQEKIVTNPPTHQTHPGCHDCLHIVQAKQLDGACLHVIQSTYNTGQQSSFGKLISGWCASRVHIKYKEQKNTSFTTEMFDNFDAQLKTLTDVNSTAHIPIILQLLLRQQEKKVQRTCVPWISIISNTIHTTVYQPLHVHLFTLPKSELFQRDQVSKSGGRQIYYIYYTKHHHHRHHPSILCLELDHICQVTHSVTSLRTRRWRN